MSPLSACIFPNTRLAAKGMCRRVQRVRDQEVEIRRSKRDQLTLNLNFNLEVQSDQPSFTSVSGTSTPSDPGKRSIRHERTDRKKQDWCLNLANTNKTQLIISNGNLKTIKDVTTHNMQIDDFPEATFRHILLVL